METVTRESREVGFVIQSHLPLIDDLISDASNNNDAIGILGIILSKLI